MFRDELKKSYLDAISQPVSEEVSGLRELDFCGSYAAAAPWRIGPFRPEPSMTFHKEKEWRDPWDIGWKSGFLFNPSLIVKDGKLYLFYRAAPRKETLCSRIGLAVWEEGKGWEDCPENPVVYPTEEDELLSAEDPKVYYAEGKYYLFYNGIFAPSAAEKEKYGAHPDMKIAVEMKYAVSEDLIHWEKRGSVVPREITGLWVKAAVIPRDENGAAVRIGGEYLMYLSEGCRGKQMIGRSDDMEHWTFEERTYLDPSPVGRLYEVACIAVPSGSEEMCMDFFCDKNGKYAAGQARFLRSDPFRSREVLEGGALTWGGSLRWKGKWIAAQGWDAKNGENLMYFYVADGNAT